MKKINSRGFTIIELLIATVSFSVILLVITGAIIQFSKVYYKGVISSKTQEVARAVSESIARDAQFSTVMPTAYSSTSTSNNYQTICIGSKRYNYYQYNSSLNPSFRLLGDPWQHMLTLDTAAGSCAPYDGNNAAVIPSDAVELLGEKMQLLQLNVGSDPATGIITVKVTVAYGNDASPTSGCPTISLGGQFCAVSTIETKVTKRL